MSIPKEPRQLMINLMYLVLTAMLALNVSAEIINAFYALNRGLKTSNGIVGDSNDKLRSAIMTQAKDNAKYAPFAKGANDAQAISKDFETYIKGYYDQLVKDAGGIDPKYGDRPVRYKDKDVTTNLMINNKKGEEMMKKIMDTRASFINSVPEGAERKAMEAQIPLMVDSISKDSKATNWPEYKFKQMPVAAVLATFSKYINDAKTSETALMNYYFNKMSIVDFKVDKFKVIISPKKSYLIKGDKFEADVALAAYNSNSNGALNASISVNGQGITLKDGQGHYESGTSSLGKQTVNATARLTNPFTGLSEEAKGSIEYEVGERSGTVSAEKMNVIYVGVDNPVEVSAAGVSSNSLKLSCGGCNATQKDNNHYIVTSDRPGTKAILTLTGENGFSLAKEFRVKGIPSPVPKINTEPFDKPGAGGGVLNSGVFAASTALLAKLENFDFDARCNIQSFVLVYRPKVEDAQQVNCNSAEFNSDVRRYVSKARAGDVFNFFEIKAKCPGDAIGRPVGTLTYLIK